MFFLFGWGRQTRKDFGPTLPMTCPNCHNQGYWHLLQSKLWFTFFFLPIFPYRSKHFLICQVCSRGVELKGDGVAHARWMRADSCLRALARSSLRSQPPLRVCLGWTPGEYFHLKEQPSCAD